MDSKEIVLIHGGKTHDKYVTQYDYITWRVFFINGIKYALCRKVGR